MTPHAHRVERAVCSGVTIYVLATNDNPEMD
jgi:hypothetical protein